MLCFYLSQTFYLDKMVSTSVTINMESQLFPAKIHYFKQMYFLCTASSTRYFQYIKALHNKYYSKPRNKPGQILKSAKN